MAAWGYSVQLNDPSDAGGSADATLVYDLQQAIGFWTQYILGAGTLTVALNIQSIALGRESGGPTSATAVGTNGGLTVYEGSGQYELMTGQHLAGTSSDITINIDPGYFQYLDLDPGLTYYSDVPTNKYNPIVVFLHELMHGFGMVGYYNQSGNLPGNYESTFDRYIVKTGSGAVFTGPNAEAVYGGPVPITTSSTDGENYGHFGNTISDNSRSPFAVQDPLTLDLMNGVVLYFDYRYPISALDLAVLKDLGYSLRTTPVVTVHDVSATRNESFAASSLFNVSFATGDSITAYQFWDSTPDSSSGAWRIAGSPVPQLAGRAIDVTAAQLSSSSFISGKIADQLWVRAYDGVLWSDWESFNVNVIDQPPVVTALDRAASHKQVFTAATLFSVTDGDGDPITAYQFWDSTVDPASGHWVVDGLPQSAGHAIDVTPGQLANAQFQSGSGTDLVWVRAYDGLQWGAWTSFDINAPVDSAPVITAPGYAANHNQNIAATDLFSVSDAESDAITAYQFWNSTFDPTSGYWVVGGVAQGAGRAIDATAAQLASVTFQSASGNDQLWVHAYDGLRWSDWTSLSVSAPVENAPAVTAHDYHAAHFENIAAGSLFTVSDADSDPITGYQFWDSTFDPASGHWVVDGAAQPVGEAINVTAAQFANATFQSGSGLDQLWLRATDGVLWSDWESLNVVAPVDRAPVASAPNYNATHFENIAAASLFSVSDSDSDTMVAYQFWDSTPDASSGRWIVGGVAQPAGQAITLTALQLSSTTFQSGATSDQLWVRANDGALWSDWTSFTVNAPVDQAPVVTAADYVMIHNRSVTAASLFSASDADGDPIAAYQFWDSNPDGLSGRWIVGGAQEPPGRAIDVTPSQFSSMTFDSGTVSDLVWVRVSDGTLWSDWESFNIIVAANHAPVITAADFMATHGQNIAAASLFSVSDADGDAMVRYSFDDLTTDAASGHWVVGGVVQPAGPVNITSSQLASVTFQSGSGSDRLSVTAYDGFDLSNGVVFNVNAPIDNAPVVTGSDATLAFGAAPLVSSLFQASDADGDAIQTYELFVPQGVNYFTVNSSYQSPGQNIFVDASSFNGARFENVLPQSATQLSERAFDGTLWSNWHAINVTTT